MESLQTILNYAAIAPFIIAVCLFIEYCWQRSASSRVSNANLIQVDECSTEQGFQASELLPVPTPVARKRRRRKAA